MEVARRVLDDTEGVEFYDDIFTAIDGADALAIVTEWKAFRSPNFSRIKAALTEPVIFDGRNLYDLGAMSTTGIEYHAIGRPVGYPNK